MSSQEEDADYRERRWALIGSAQAIIEMHEEIKHLKGEVARLKDYEKKYHDLLGESITHSQKMAQNQLILAMSMGVGGAERLSETLERFGGNNKE